MARGRRKSPRQRPRNPVSYVDLEGRKTTLEDALEAEDPDFLAWIDQQFYAKNEKQRAKAIEGWATHLGVPLPVAIPILGELRKQGPLLPREGPIVIPTAWIHPGMLIETPAFFHGDPQNAPGAIPDVLEVAVWDDDGESLLHPPGDQSVSWDYNTADYPDYVSLIPPSYRTPAAAAPEIATALAQVNRHRAQIGMRPLDPAAAGWTEQDVLLEARRIAASRDRDDNPPWSDRLLAKHGAELAALVGPPLMPQRTGARQLELPDHVELGVGAYGVALPTHTPGVVLKLTTDPLEASFVLASFAMGPPPVGIVRYYGIAPLFGAKHERRAVYAIWREQAVLVEGFTALGVPTAAVARDLHRSESLTSAWKEIATELYGRYIYRLADRDWVVVSQQAFARLPSPSPSAEQEAAQIVRWYRDNLVHAPTKPLRAAPGKRRHHAKAISVPSEDMVEGVVTYLRALQIVADDLERKTTAGMWIGNALHEYLVHGRIVLPDMHAGNIGLVRRDETDLGRPVNEGGVLLYAITDPGVALFLDDRWAEAAELSPQNLPKLPRWAVAA